MPRPLEASYNKDLQAINRMRDRIIKDQRISHEVKDALTSGIDLVIASVTLAPDMDIAVQALDRKLAVLSSAVDRVKGFIAAKNNGA